MELRKRVDARIINEVGWAVALSSSRRVIAGQIRGAQTPSVPEPDRSEDQGVQPLSVPVPLPTQRQPAAPMPASDQQWVQDEITALQRAFQEEQE